MSRYTIAGVMLVTFLGAVVGYGMGFLTASPVVVGIVAFWCGGVFGARISDRHHRNAEEVAT